MTIQVVHTIAEARQVRWQDSGASWGIVPTMGFLHEGHFSLVRKAADENDFVAVSIFVNPTQFGDPNDLDMYPRNLEADVAALKELGVALVFAPTVAEMYPAGFQTTVSLAEASRPLEGAARPGHFDGVATIVTKLFNILQPTRAYFGQKDAQQTVVLRQMVRDLNLNLDLIICPTMRERDGLALSSRNTRLSKEERQAATILYSALKNAEALINEGVRNGDSLREAMTNLIASEPLARLDYVSVADAITLAELDEIQGEILLSMAVFIGPIRLIDNFLLQVP